MFKKLGYKDRKRRKSFNQKELYNRLNRSLKKNLELYDIDSKDVSPLIFKKYSKISKVSIRNRCILTYRGRGIVSKFKISRIIFRQKAGAGEIPGIHKSN